MKATWTMSVGLLTCLIIVPSANADETSPLPQQVRNELNFMAGTWQSELTEGGKNIGISNHERKWSPGKHCLIMTSRGEREGVTTFATGISGWNAKGKAIVEHWYVSDGRSGVVRYPIAKMTNNAWVGTHRFVDAEGKEMKGSCRLEKSGNDQWVFTADWEADGEKVTIKNITRRVKK